MVDGDGDGDGVGEGSGIYHNRTKFHSEKGIAGNLICLRRLWWTSGIRHNTCLVLHSFWNVQRLWEKDFIVIVVTVSDMFSVPPEVDYSSFASSDSNRDGDDDFSVSFRSSKESRTLNKGSSSVIR